MTLLEALAVLASGVVAGGVNAMVGSGSLLTFPVLLAVGYPSVTANVSNTMGLLPGNVSAMWGYRRELRGQARRCLLLGSGTVLGSAAGAALLLALPSTVFDRVVPFLILLACALMALRPHPSITQIDPTRRRLALLILITYAVGVYGGYFGAAQGVILLACLRLLVHDSLQRLNAVKNVLVGTSNGVSALAFILFAHIAWEPAALLAAGSVGGAQIGAHHGRRLPDRILRRAIIATGTTVAIVLLVS
jgi:uncharacterized membrane protein YfcA